MAASLPYKKPEAGVLLPPFMTEEMEMPRDQSDLPKVMGQGGPRLSAHRSLLTLCQGRPVPMMEDS